MDPLTIVSLSLMCLGVLVLAGRLIYMTYKRREPVNRLRELLKVESSERASEPAPEGSLALTSLHSLTVNEVIQDFENNKEPGVLMALVHVPNVYAWDLYKPALIKIANAPILRQPLRNLDTSLIQLRDDIAYTEEIRSLSAQVLRDFELDERAKDLNARSHALLHNWKLAASGRIPSPRAHYKALTAANKLMLDDYDKLKDDFSSLENSQSISYYEDLAGSLVSQTNIDFDLAPFEALRKQSQSLTKLAQVNASRSAAKKLYLEVVKAATKY